MKLLLLFLALPLAPAAEDPRTLIQPTNSHLHVRADLNPFLTRCKTDKQAHVAFLGGSITQNTRGHTAMVPAWLKQRFPDTQFTFTNAGIASTCSTSGAFRLGRHILDKGPLDLLIVEFAVNDDQDATHPRKVCIRGMEGIVRQVREKSPRTSIVMVHFVNPPILEKLQNGKTPVSIAAHETVATHYGIISVNLAAEIADATKAGRYTWQDYGGTHPKPFGYRIASNMIIAAMERALASTPATKPPALPGPIDPGSYFHASFIDPAKARRSGDWKLGKVSRELLPKGSIRPLFHPYTILRGDRPGDQLTLDFTGRAIGAFVLAGPDAGIVETRIDDGPPTKHDLHHHFSKSLNYPHSIIFASDLEPARHQLHLQISPDKNPASTGHAVSILFFEVNG